VLSGRAVSWTSSDAGVATVDASGAVRAVAPGTAVVTAASEGLSASATVAVTPVPVASVDVAPAAVTLAAGAGERFTATPRDADGNPLSGRAVVWASSDAAVASVDAAGFVRAGAPGTTTITATAEGRTGAAAVTVAPGSVANVQVTPGQSTLPAGRTQQLSATLTDAEGNVLTGRVVTWSTTNAAVAAVTPEGLVTAGIPGPVPVTVTITAASEGKVATATVTVTPVVASVRIGPENPVLNPGQRVQIGVRPYDATGRELPQRPSVIISSNPSVASISNTGMLTAGALGTAIVTATIEGRSASTTVRVVPPVGPEFVTACGGIGAQGPPGYVLYDRRYSLPCGGPAGSINANTYVRYANRPIDYVLSVCIGAQTPPGWVEVGYAPDFFRCGGTSGANNTKAIRNVTNPEF
jgi:uncharacterized protein YjdB